MSAEAKTIEPARDRVTQSPSNAAERYALRIAEKPERSSVQRLIDLTTSLLREAQTIAGDKALADESQRLQALTFPRGSISLVRLSSLKPA